MITPTERACRIAWHKAATWFLFQIGQNCGVEAYEKIGGAKDYAAHARAIRELRYQS